MDIKINSKFRIKGKEYNWTLVELYDGKDGKGNYKQHERHLYFSSFSWALRTACERSLLGCELAEDILDRINKFEEDVVAAYEKIGITEVPDKDREPID